MNARTLPSQVAESVFEVWTGDDAPPHFSGPIEIEAGAVLRIRWLGEQEWVTMEWWEVLAYMREPNPQWSAVVAEVYEERMDRAFKEGFDAGLENSVPQRSIPPDAQPVDSGGPPTGLKQRSITK